MSAIKPLTKIKPLHNIYYDCILDQAVSVAAWWGRDHRLAFAESWDFVFDPVGLKSKAMGQRLSANRVPSTSSEINLLKKYHGIKITKQNQKDAAEALPEIRKSLAQGRPLLINGDSYWLPWDPNYRKSHNEHFCIIAGINELDNTIYCIDAFYERENELLAYENFQKFFFEIAEFSLLEESINSTTWKEVLEIALAKIPSAFGKGTIFDDMRLFANEMEDSPDFSEFRGYKNAAKVPLISKLNSIKKYRLRLGYLLRYLYTIYKSKQFLEFSEMFDQMYYKWELVTSLLVKIYFKPLISIDISKRIADKIRDIANEEEATASILARFCREGAVDSGLHDVIFTGSRKPVSKEVPSIECKQDSASEDIISEVTILDLKQYFNNNGIGNPQSNCTADLSGAGQFLEFREIMADGTWHIGATKFSFPKIADGINDNISCQNQEIIVPDGRYGSISLLGCSEWGDYFEKIELSYTGGYNETINVKFTACTDPPKFGEKIACTTKCVDSCDKPKLEAYLFVQTYHLNSEHELQKIKLPDCMNMHIFAISLNG